MVFGESYPAWEWFKEFAIRNALYPSFLAAPLFVIKYLGLDSMWVVV